MKLDYVDKEYPTGLDESATKIITSNDLAKLLGDSIPTIDKLRKNVVEISDKLSGTDKTVSGNIDAILMLNKEVSDLINKLNSNVNDLK